MIKSSSHSKETYSLKIQKQIEEVLSRVGDFKLEVAQILEPFAPTFAITEVESKIETLFLRFHAVAIQLQKRSRQEKQPFNINDEYDVQDLLHGLLWIFFNDVEAENYGTPSTCGTNPRIDFFLRDEKVYIEAKIATENHRRKKIAEELILDKEYYSKKVDLNGIFCLVYDPLGLIDNPIGFEKDLSEPNSRPKVRVFVVPRTY
jgi:hypothetical protein